MTGRLRTAALVGAALAALCAFWWLDLGRFLSLEHLQAQRGALAAFRDARPFAAGSLFFATYVAAAALSVPGAVVLTLAGGAIFGLAWGTVLVSCASTLGATGAFLAARHLLRNRLQRRYGDRLTAVNEGVRRDGPFYLFTLRLVPVFPFFLINLLLGLTAMPTRTFFWVSQIGMLAGTVVYVNAGTQLAKLDSLEGILSPNLIGAFALLGLFPLVARKAAIWLRNRNDAREQTRET